MRGLKHPFGNGYKRSQCRIFYRCVDWNRIISKCDKKRSSRIFYRCVDWNKLHTCFYCVSKVASFTDAWIETLGLIRDKTFIKSHLLQMRGLKHVIEIFGRWESVASFTDAWIETLDKEDDWKDPAVASFTDAWIETHRRSSGTTAIMVASFTDAWIETDKYFIKLSLSLSHLLQMRGLKQLTPLPVC